jgi:hypothetical protein
VEGGRIRRYSRFVAEDVECVQVEPTNVRHNDTCAVLVNARNKRFEPAWKRFTVAVKKHNHVKLGLLRACKKEKRKVESWRGEVERGRGSFMEEGGCDADAVVRLSEGVVRSWKRVCSKEDPCDVVERGRG